jgi:hypothetical protein
MTPRIAGLAIAFAALTIPSALFAQQHQFPQYPTRAMHQYPTHDMLRQRPGPHASGLLPRPTPRPSGRVPRRSGYNNLPGIYVNGADYLRTPAPQQTSLKPKHKATPRPADAPDVFDTNSTR